MYVWTKENFHRTYEKYSDLVYRLCLLYLKNESVLNQRSLLKNHLRRKLQAKTYLMLLQLCRKNTEKYCIYIIMKSIPSARSAN